MTPWSGSASSTRPSVRLPAGRVSAQVSLPAQSLAHACAAAIAAVSSAFVADAVACEVMTEAEFDAREGFTRP